MRDVGVLGEIAAHLCRAVAVASATCSSRYRASKAAGPAGRIERHWELAATGRFVEDLGAQAAGEFNAIGVEGVDVGDRGRTECLGEGDSENSD
ncbi:hypothetical protein AB0M05_19150 [Streptomyces violaceusniger]|uniref:hypothetical protein n=1 Tax=Streptomyces violaceusniger TaxID=68280 RepID=UPI00341F16F3